MQGKHYYKVVTLWFYNMFVSLLLAFAPKYDFEINIQVPFKRNSA